MEQSDLEHITLSYAGGVEDMEEIIRHRRIFPCALKKGPFFAAMCFLHHGLPGEQFRSSLGMYWILLDVMFRAVTLTR